MFKLFSVLSFALIAFIPNSLCQTNNSDVLLYSQTTNPGISYIPSVYYGIGHTWNCQVADDFISTGHWSIDQIIVSGSYSDTYVFAEGFDIYFYSNKNNKPDSLVYSAANQPFSIGGDLFTIPLTNPVELVAGNYWISVQAILNWNNYPYEDWAWNQVTGAYDIEAKYQKPGNGSSGCSSWNSVSTCNNVSKTDMYFELYGALLTSVELTTFTPSNYSLEQNYPNPFNPSTKISWQTQVASYQTLKVYDVLGNKVATLIDGYREAGKHEVTFDASKLSSGIYFYELQAGSFVEKKKMLLLK